MTRSRPRGLLWRPPWRASLPGFDVREIARVAPRCINSRGLLRVAAVPPHAMTLAGGQKGHRGPKVASAQDTNFLGFLLRVVVDVLLEGGARGRLGSHVCASMAFGCSESFSGQQLVCAGGACDGLDWWLVEL